MSISDLRDDNVGAEVLDAGDRRHQLDCGAKGPKICLHLCINRGHSGIKGVNLIEMKAQQEPMVLGDAAAKRLAEFLR